MSLVRRKPERQAIYKPDEYAQVLKADDDRREPFPLGALAISVTSLAFILPSVIVAEFATAKHNLAFQAVAVSFLTAAALILVAAVFAVLTQRRLRGVMVAGILLFSSIILSAAAWDHYRSLPDISWLYGGDLPKPSEDEVRLKTIDAVAVDLTTRPFTLVNPTDHVLDNLSIECEHWGAASDGERSAPASVDHLKLDLHIPPYSRVDIGKHLRTIVPTVQDRITCKATALDIAEP